MAATGVSQRELARRLGVTPARLCQLLALRRLGAAAVACVRQNPAAWSERRLRPLTRLAPAAQLAAVRKVARDLDA